MREKFKIFLIVIFLQYFFLNNSFVYGADNYIKKAIDEVNTNNLENYIKEESSYFNDINLDIKKIIYDALNGNVDLNIVDYIKYQIKNEQNFFGDIIKTSISIIAICILLTIIKYFAEDLNGKSISEIVAFISIIIVFMLIANDISYIKKTLEIQFNKINTIIEDINTLFLSIIISFGKISIVDFFSQYSKYIISITTDYIYKFTEIMTIAMLLLTIINNISSFINVKLLFKLIKKATLIVFSIYIIIVVINFSVQGYIYYKADNIFVNTVKAISPSSVPMVGNAVNNFFGLFIKSVMLIKDIAGIVVILFIFSLFGSSLIRIFFMCVLYRITAAIIEPLNEKISYLINDLGDILYVYLVCLFTPIIVITAYYSIILSYLNKIFG